MKPTMIVRLSLLLIPVVVGSSSFAQDTIPYKTLPPITVTATTKKIPEKVWRNFGDYFANAHNPKWYELNKNYLVKFMMDEETNNALFTKRGNLIYNISYGYEKSLPDDLRKQVKTSYIDYDITRAIKVTEAGRVIWVVNLEDAKNLIMVRLEDGELEEVQKMNKS